MIGKAKKVLAALGLAVVLFPAAARAQTPYSEPRYDLAVMFASIIFGSPFFGPHLLMGDDFLDPGYFLDYPSAGGADGYLYSVDRGEANAWWDLPPGCQRWSLMAAVEGVRGLDEVDRLSLRLRVDTVWRAGIETEWTWMGEELFPGVTDEKVMGELNLLFRFAQHEQVQMRFGAGARLLLDGGHADVGCNFSYAIEA